MGKINRLRNSMRDSTIIHNLQKPVTSVTSFPDSHLNRYITRYKRTTGGAAAQQFRRI